MPTSSAGIDGSRSSRTTSGRMPNDQPPALAGRVLLRVGRHLDDGEDRLPHARVADCKIALRDGRPARRRVALEHEPRRRQRSVAPAADEGTSAGQTRSMTAAIAWPKPMHMQAMP